MSIMRRVRDMTVANLNELIERSEDPIKLIDQYLLAQHEQIRQTEQLLQQCAHHVQSLEQQYIQIDQLLQRRDRQATLALQAGEEDLARMALTEKMMNEERKEQYARLYEQSKEQLAELEAQMAMLKDDYEQVYGKRQYYIARMETVRLQQKMNQRLDRVGPGNMKMFDQLEQNVGQWEMETMILSEIKRSGRSMGSAIGGTVQDAVDRELEQLKKKLTEKGDEIR